MSSIHNQEGNAALVMVTAQPIMSLSHKGSLHLFQELEKQPSILEEDEEEEEEEEKEEHNAQGSEQYIEEDGDVDVNDDAIDNSDASTVESDETLKINLDNKNPLLKNRTNPTSSTGTYQSYNHYRVPSISSHGTRRDNHQLLSVNSTMTFEKQKVIPHRSRTHSGQSVLSNISLRSALHHMPTNDNNNTNENSTDENHNNNVTSVGSVMPNSLIEITQQIQSPMMCSVRRKGLNSAGTINSVTGTNSNNTSNSISFRGTSSDKINEIGLQEPFIEDNRLELDSNNNMTLTKSSSESQNQDEISETNNSKNDAVDKVSKNNNNDQNDKLKSPTKTVIEDDANDDNEQLQRELTALALKSLSNIKGLNVANAFASITNITNIDHSEDNKTASKSSESNDTQGNKVGSMTHLQFGKKKVFLDSSPSVFGSDHQKHFSETSRNQNESGIINNDMNPNSANAKIQNQQLKSSASNSNFGSNREKRFLRQISNPKKPMYLPAVLRNVSETNITNDDVMWSSLIHNSSQINTNHNASSISNYFANDSSSSRGSIHSTSSYVIDSCKKRISSLFSQSGDHEGSPYPTLEKPIPPTTAHWVPDSKRNSCKYCHKLFTFWERKHHCRHCGDIFCQQHSRHWLYLNPKAEFIIGGGSGVGTLSKVCIGCAEKYESLIRSNGPLSRLQFENTLSPNETEGHAKISSVGAGANVSKHIMKSSKTLAIDVKGNGLNLDPDDGEGASIVGGSKKAQEVLNSVVGSVPVDWNWSSF